MQNKVSTMKCLRDRANSVQTYTSTYMEYEFNIETKTQTPCSARKNMGIKREVIRVDWGKNEWYQLLTLIPNKNNSETYNCFSLVVLCRGRRICLCIIRHMAETFHHRNFVLYSIVSHWTTHWTCLLFKIPI